MRARSRWGAESPSLAGVAPAAPRAWLESRQPHRNYVALVSPDPPATAPTLGRGQHSSACNIDPQRVQVAAGNPDRVRQGGRAHQRHLPVRALSPDQEPPRARQIDYRDRPQDPHCRLPRPPTKAFPTTSSAKRCSTAATPRTPRTLPPPPHPPTRTPWATRSLSSRYRRPPDLTPPPRWTLFSIQLRDGGRAQRGASAAV